MPSARGFLPPLPPLPLGRPPLPLPRPRPVDGGVSAAADDGDIAAPANATRPLPLPRLPRGRPPRFFPRTTGVLVTSIDESISSSLTIEPIPFVLPASSVVEVVMFFRTAFLAASHSWVPYTADRFGGGKRSSIDSVAGENDLMVEVTGRSSIGALIIGVAAAGATVDAALSDAGWIELAGGMAAGRETSEEGALATDGLSLGAVDMSTSNKGSCDRQLDVQHDTVGSYGGDAPPQVRSDSHSLTEFHGSATASPTSALRL